MSTIALNRLLDYILTLSLTDREKELFSLFGAWSDDTEIDVMEKAINEGRTSGISRNIISFDEV